MRPEDALEFSESFGAIGAGWYRQVAWAESQGMARRATARQGRHGEARRGQSGHGRARQAWHGESWQGEARRGRARQAWHGEARQGAAGQGQARQARRGGARPGEARQAMKLAGDRRKGNYRNGTSEESRNS